jgi:hypothetical protein
MYVSYHNHVCLISMCVHVCPISMCVSYHIHLSLISMWVLYHIHVSLISYPCVSHIHVCLISYPLACVSHTLTLIAANLISSSQLESSPECSYPHLSSKSTQPIAWMGMAIIYLFISSLQPYHPWEWSSYICSYPHCSLARMGMVIIYLFITSSHPIAYIAAKKKCLHRSQ